MAPIDFSAVRRVLKHNRHELAVGLNVGTYYNYPMYPDLQSGYLFWVTEIGASICLDYTYR